MIAGVIAWSLRNRFLVGLGTVTLVIAGIWAIRTTPVDALPDLSDVQVVIQTEFSEQAPQIVEDQVTYPIASEMLKVPGARVVRGFSFFGTSLVYVLFEDGTDLYWARSRVLEYRNGLRQRLPVGVEPTLGPDATGVGWVFEYVLESDSLDLAQLRTLQDWYVRYQLTAIPGVSEVASLGGYVKQYQVEVNPERLRAFRVPVMRVVQAIGAHNADVGARVIEMGGREYMIRGLGYLRTVQEIENVALGATMDGTPIRVGDVATVQVGPAPRRGAADLNGRGEVVAGIVIMRFGSDALKTLNAVKQRITEVQRTLPHGVRLVPVYDRSDLIHRAIANQVRAVVYRHEPDAVRQGLLHLGNAGFDRLDRLERIAAKAHDHDPGDDLAPSVQVRGAAAGGGPHLHGRNICDPNGCAVHGGADRDVADLLHGAEVAQ